MVSPLVGSALVSGGAGLLGGLFGNRSRAKEAARDRQWQEMMSNTAYQRAARDLEAAGLNRILALGSPASTPGGSTAQMGNPMEGAIQGAMSAVNTGLGVRRQRQELKNMAANEVILKKQADKLDADILQVLTNTQLTSAKQKAMLTPAKIGELTSNALNMVEKMIQGTARNRAEDTLKIIEAIQKIRGSKTGKETERLWNESLDYWTPESVK